MNTSAEAQARLRVLVIDDEEGVRKAVRRVLSAHDVVLCADGASGLAELEARRFDVILCDFNMPGGLSGLEVYGAIAERWPQLAPRVVFLSGGTLTAEHAPERLPCPWLDKPFLPDELRRLVASIAARAPG